MVEVSRRSVLGVGAGTIAALAVGVEQSADAAPSSAAAGPPVRSHFSAAVGGIFTARNGSTAHRLHLDRIEDLQPAGDRATSFSLIFSVRGKQKSIADGIWTLTRTGTPTHELFLSAVNDGAAARMQAVVNRTR